MWPSGKAWVCKTFYGGSNPPVTSVFSYKQSLDGAVFLHSLFVLEAYIG